MNSEIMVQACKDEYEIKKRELEEQKQQVDSDTRAAQMLMNNATKFINIKSNELNLETEKRLQRQFDSRIQAFYGVLIGLLLYGLLTTVFTAVRSKVFIRDFKTFFTVIWGFLYLCFKNLVKCGLWIAKLGDKIPQHIIAIIVHYFLLIVFVGGITVAVGFLLFICIKKLYVAYTDNYADVISLAEIFVSLAVVVYFAAPIRSVLPINLILLIIIVHMIYICIRFACDNLL